MNIIKQINKKTRKKIKRSFYDHISFFTYTTSYILSGSLLSTLRAFHRMSASAYTGALVALMPFCGKVGAFNVVRGEQC